jgi:hypothetical protein
MVDKAFSFSAASLAASSCIHNLCDLLIIRGALMKFCSDTIGRDIGRVAAGIGRFSKPTASSSQMLHSAIQRQLGLPKA